MPKSTTIGSFLFKNIFLLVLAAWLVTISFVIDNYWSADASLKSVQKKIAAYVHEQENDFKLLTSDKKSMMEVEKEVFSESYLKLLTQKKYFLFFYNHIDSSSSALVCWNTQKVLPVPSMLYSNETKGFIKLNNGYYVWHKYISNQLKIIALIPVKWDYFISNEYLENNFVVDEFISGNYDISNYPKNALSISSVEGTPLFYVYQKNADVIKKNNPYAILLQILALAFLLLFFHFLCSFIIKNKSSRWGFFIFFSVIIFCRLLSYYFPFPINFRQFELFDPAIYATGSISRSLGDLLVNALIFVWLVLFVRHHYLQKVKTIQVRSIFLKWAFLIIGSAVILFTTFTAANTIRSLIIDSQISFDVINFFTLTEYSIIGFLVLCCISIGYYFFCKLLLTFLQPFFIKKTLAFYLVLALVGLIILSFRIGYMQGGFEIYVLGWTILFLLLLNTPLADFLSKRIISSKLVFWLVFFSISISAIIQIENNSKEVDSRRHYAEILAMKSDPANETMINSMLTDFRSDFFIANFDRLSSPTSAASLKDSLISSNSSGYTNKFDTHIYVYNAAENPLFNEAPESYEEINNILKTQSKPTSISGLYYFDQSFNQFSYLSKITLKDTANQLMGYIFILASPKKQRRDALYPELFSKGENSSIENSSLYAFAIYNNNKLITSHNDYPFPSQLRKALNNNRQFTLIQKKLFSELWYYASADRVVVIAKENYRFIESITLFSYLFCSFLLVSIIFWLIDILIKTSFRKISLKNFWQFSIRNQIHFTIIFISVVSFLVIGFATIYFFIMRYEENNREKLSRTIRIMEKEVKSTLSNNDNKADTGKINKVANDKLLEQSIDKISEIHGVDVNLYDLEGNLLVSSLPLPYNKGILSTKMNPIAFYHLSKQKEIQYFQMERIGNLQFTSNYVPVIDPMGNNFAYLNIPYFTSQNKLKQEISNFLITIINLNAFIFLIAGIIALFIANRITHSFSVISEKMKKINLGSHNEAIEWNRDDEIGALIIEYNRMVSKLDESAEALAKTEREGAWKEMARQVAHEIKNPLTPMKLSIQFLQKSIESNAPNTKELSVKVARTLIEQIDHLSHIANDFSQFAHIGESKKEIINYNDILKSVIQLNSLNEHVYITANLLTEPMLIKADKTQINRLFTNLIINAIQSVEAPSIALIEINQSITDGKILTTISDNGSGIDESVQAKIFSPNFTTKTSGTGLGLAMCKRIVEQTEGEIWFETTLQKGTTFFIEIPVSS